MPLLTSVGVINLCIICFPFPTHHTSLQPHFPRLVSETGLLTSPLSLWGNFCLNHQISPLFPLHFRGSPASLNTHCVVFVQCSSVSVLWPVAASGFYVTEDLRLEWRRPVGPSLKDFTRICKLL